MAKIIDMTCPNPTNDENNLLQTNNIVLHIDKVPQLTSKLRAVSLPSLGLNTNEVSSSSRTTPFIGTTLTYGRLTCTLAINANMSNYNLIFAWMKALGFPDNPSQFMNIPEHLQFSDNYRVPYDQRLHGLFPGDDDESYGKSDGTLFIMSDKDIKVATAVVRFEDLYPIDLSDIEFVINASEPTYAIVSVTFAYDKFELIVENSRNYDFE